MDRELMEIQKSQAEAIERESDSQRKAAEKEMVAKHGAKKANRMILKPTYKLDERLGCNREVD